VCTCTQPHIDTLTHTRTHAHVHARMHTHTHTHTHTRTNTIYTLYARASPPPPFPLPRTPEKFDSTSALIRLLFLNLLEGLNTLSSSVLQCICQCSLRPSLHCIGQPYSVAHCARLLQCICYCCSASVTVAVHLYCCSASVIELQRPSIKGAKLLLKVTRAIIIIMT